MVLIDLDATAAYTQIFPDDLLDDRHRQLKPIEVKYDDIHSSGDDAEDTLLDELLNDDKDYGKEYAEQHTTTTTTTTAFTKNGSPKKESSRTPSNGTSTTSESNERYERSRHAKHQTPSDNTSSTHTADDLYSDDADDPQERVVGLNEFVMYRNNNIHQNHQHHGNKNNSTQDDDDNSSVSSIHSHHPSLSSSSHQSSATAALLERAHDRLALQQLQDELVKLQTIVESKDQEIEHLSGQLRRAVSTKCDLVLAHTALERHHEYHLELEARQVQQLKRSHCSLQEEHSEIERQFLDEMVQLEQELKNTKTSHQQELDDWERMHRNEMLEKDFEIAQLQEQVRELQFGSDERDGIWYPDKRSKSKDVTNKKRGMKVVFRKN